MKPLLVGELNPHGADPAMALYPLPETGSGGRLQRILGLSRGEYLRRFDRANLCAGTWDPWKARAAARALLSTPDRRVIALGTKVARALGFPAARLFNVAGVLDNGTWVYVLPHPSGRNRVWNDPTAELRARALLRPFLRDDS